MISILKVKTFNFSHNNKYPIIKIIDQTYKEVYKRAEINPDIPGVYQTNDELTGCKDRT